MSVMGIASSSIFNFLSGSMAKSHGQNFQQEFQQLGQDLSSGNLSAAQADFQALQPQSGAASSSSGQSSTNPLTSALSQLATDLKSGNVTAAQQDYATVKQDLSSMGGHHTHHHHHHDGGAQDASQNPVQQLFAQLGQALQAGNVSAAQGAYSALAADFQETGGGAAVSPVSVTA